MIREEPYLGLKVSECCGNMAGRKDTKLGAAWLSSARAVSVGLSPATSATPIFSCQRVMSGTLKKLPVQTVRKVGMTSSQHGPYVQGYTRATMASTEGSYMVT